MHYNLLLQGQLVSPSRCTICNFIVKETYYELISLRQRSGNLPVFVETWYGRNENLIHVARTQWQRNKNGIKSFAVRATSKETVASLC
jgi:hypothetical protein